MFTHIFCVPETEEFAKLVRFYQKSSKNVSQNHARNFQDSKIIAKNRTKILTKILTNILTKIIAKILTKINAKIIAKILTKTLAKTSYRSSYKDSLLRRLTKIPPRLANSYVQGFFPNMLCNNFVKLSDYKSFASKFLLRHSSWSLSSTNAM